MHTRQILRRSVNNHGPSLWLAAPKHRPNGIAKSNALESGAHVTRCRSHKAFEEEKNSSGLLQTSLGTVRNEESPYDSLHSVTPRVNVSHLNSYDNNYYSGYATDAVALRVSNLDWTMIMPDCERLLRKAVAQNNNPAPILDLIMKPITRRNRDIGKHHAGTAILTFEKASFAESAVESILQHQGELGQGGKLRVEHIVIPAKAPIPRQLTTTLTPERVALRQARAASYARRRERVAAATDAIVAAIVAKDSLCNRPVLSPQRHPWQVSSTLSNRTSSSIVPVLHAPALNWSSAPAEIDPARGGGLHDADDSRQNRSKPLFGRATRKRAAVEAFLMVVRDALLPRDNVGTDGSSVHGVRSISPVADLGCGAGNLALPLAWWLQHERPEASLLSSCAVLGIDINGFSLQRLRDRTGRVARPTDGTSGKDGPPLVATLQLDLLNLLSNATTTPFQSMRETNVPSFSDCAAVVSLHACGAASDLAIAAAVRHGLPFAVSPCCIGKVMASRSDDGALPSTDSRSPYPSFTKRTAAPIGTICYPRSSWLKCQITGGEYNLIAAAADYGATTTADIADHDTKEILRFQRSRLAKQIVETDRLQWAQEHGFFVRMLELPRIGPVYSKRELLLGAIIDSPAAKRIACLAVSSRN